MSEPAPPSPPAQPPPSFGSLAKKIRGRTSDLLAIAIVVIGGLAVGSQVSRWWDKAGDPDGDTLKNVGTDAAGFGEREPLTLDFGNSPYSMIRNVAQGDRKTATQQLVDECLSTAKTARFPDHAPSPAENKLLARITTEKPLLQGDGWRLFRVDGPLTMVSVVREPTSRPGDANAAPRVVCWGLAFPAGEQRWVLYRFVSAGGATQTGFAERIPLPASAAPLLTLRGGNSLWRTFRSAEPVDSLRAFYAGWFRENRWTMTNSSGKWTAVFTKDRLRAEVRISAQGPRGCTGVVVVTNMTSN
jgi:hypothetical protein